MIIFTLMHYGVGGKNLFYTQKYTTARKVSVHEYKTRNKNANKLN